MNSENHPPVVLTSGKNRVTKYTAVGSGKRISKNEATNIASEDMRARIFGGKAASTTKGAFQIKSAAPQTNLEEIKSPTLHDEDFKVNLQNSLTRKSTAVVDNSALKTKLTTETSSMKASTFGTSSDSNSFGKTANEQTDNAQESSVLTNYIPVPLSGTIGASAEDHNSNTLLGRRGVTDDFQSETRTLTHAQEVIAEGTVSKMKRDLLNESMSSDALSDVDGRSVKKLNTVNGSEPTTRSAVYILDGRVVARKTSAFGASNGQTTNTTTVNTSTFDTANFVSELEKVKTSRITANTFKQSTSSAPPTLARTQKNLSRSASGNSNESSQDGANSNTLPRRGFQDDHQSGTSTPTHVQEVITEGTVSRLTRDLFKNTQLTGGMISPSGSSVSSMERKKTLNTQVSPDSNREAGKKYKFVVDGIDNANAVQEVEIKRTAGFNLANEHSLSLRSQGSDSDNTGNSLLRPSLNRNLTDEIRNKATNRTESSGIPSSNEDETERLNFIKSQLNQQLTATHEISQLQRTDSQSSASDELASARARLRSVNNGAELSREGSFQQRTSSAVLERSLSRGSQASEAENSRGSLKSSGSTNFKDVRIITTTTGSSASAAQNSSEDETGGLNTLRSQLNTQLTSSGSSFEIQKIQKQDSQSAAAEDLAAVRAKLRYVNNAELYKDGTNDPQSPGTSAKTIFSSIEVIEKAIKTNDETPSVEEISANKVPHATLNSATSRVVIENSQKTPINLQSQNHDSLGFFTGTEQTSPVDDLILRMSAPQTDRAPSSIGSARGSKDHSSKNSSFSVSHNSGRQSRASSDGDHESEGSRRMVGEGREKIKRQGPLSVDVAGTYPGTSSSENTPSEAYESLTWNKPNGPPRGTLNSDSTMTGDSDNEYEGGRTTQIIGREKIRRAQSQEEPDDIRGKVVVSSGEYSPYVPEQNSRQQENRSESPYLGRDSRVNSRQKMQREESSEPLVYPENERQAYQDRPLLQRDSPHREVQNTSPYLGREPRAASRQKRIRDDTSEPEIYSDDGSDTYQRRLIPKLESEQIQLENSSPYQGREPRVGSRQKIQRDDNSEHEEYSENDPQSYRKRPLQSQNSPPQRDVHNNSPYLGRDPRVGSRQKVYRDDISEDPYVENERRAHRERQERQFDPHGRKLYSDDEDSRGPYMNSGDDPHSEIRTYTDYPNVYKKNRHTNRVLQDGRQSPIEVNRTTSVMQSKLDYINPDDDYQNVSGRIIVAGDGKNKKIGKYPRSRSRDRNFRQESEGPEYWRTQTSSNRHVSNLYVDSESEYTSVGSDTPVTYSEHSLESPRGIRLINANLSHTARDTATPVAGIITVTNRSASVSTGNLNGGTSGSATPVMGIINLLSPRAPSVAGIIRVNSQEQSPDYHGSDYRKTTLTPVPVIGPINVSRGQSPYPNQGHGDGGYNNNHHNNNMAVMSSVEITTQEPLELAGIDPELRAAQKTGNVYHISMNVKPALLSRPPSRQMLSPAPPRATSAMRTNSQASMYRANNVYPEDEGQYGRSVSVMNIAEPPQRAFSPQQRTYVSPRPNVEILLERAASRADSDVAFQLQLINMPEVMDRKVVREESISTDRFVIAHVDNTVHDQKTSTGPRFSMGDVTETPPSKNHIPEVVVNRQRVNVVQQSKSRPQLSSPNVPQGGYSNSTYSSTETFSSDPHFYEDVKQRNHEPMANSPNYAPLDDWDVVPELRQGRSNTTTTTTKTEMRSVAPTNAQNRTPPPLRNSPIPTKTVTKTFSNYSPVKKRTAPLRPDVNQYEEVPNRLRASPARYNDEIKKSTSNLTAGGRPLDDPSDVEFDDNLSRDLHNINSQMNSALSPSGSRADRIDHRNGDANFSRSADIPDGRFVSTRPRDVLSEFTSDKYGNSLAEKMDQKSTAAKELLNRSALRMASSTAKSSASRVDLPYPDEDFDQDVHVDRGKVSMYISIAF